jgi:hypothetical protein
MWNIFSSNNNNNINNSSGAESFDNHINIGNLNTHKLPLLTNYAADNNNSTTVNTNANKKMFDEKVRFPPMFILPAWYLVLACLVSSVAFALAATVFKDKLDDIGVTTIDILQYGSIPLVSVVFTYCHIWLALWMTFYPIKFFGLWQMPGTNTGLGWQGIIPFKAEKMARMSVKLMTENLLDVREVFSRLDPERVVLELTPLLDRILTDCIVAIAQQYSADIW